MRISTVTMFESSLSSMNRQQSDFLKVGQQLATGRRVVNPSDDPQAASRAVSVSQSMALTQQYADSRVTAANALSQEESVLNSVSDGIASAKTLIIQAGNGTLSDADRASIAAELRGVYENLLGQANATDGNGTYLFGGYKDDAPPFVKATDGSVSYKGSDEGVREQQVDASRRMPVGDNGKTVFEGVPSGAGYVASAAPGNNGSVTFTGPTRVDAADPGYGDGYEVSFADNAGVLEYTVTNTTTGNAVPGHTGVTYTAGDSLEFGGLSVTLEGAAQAGDTISMAKAEDRSIFTTLENAIAALEAPTESAKARAALQNTLSTTSRELDNSLDNVLTVRASVGARLNELDVLDSVGGNRSLTYEQTLSELVDLDYAKAISDYTLRQVGLQASQKAFVDIQGMSLFDRL
ncbi:flagellar hook-associated protein 3 FlgL [Modicisalibacter ilicicola DSM 19980]|uniref:Flagellar hook-associated protein 3 FlgL n=1 Tax=Modicisalibacter ilicicola DSM 19980 TaxID=1121942 RepID=A0A1M4Z155_9GAMM|nr:flagellar hook-associated protein FlgL [Halomonas ilicicola]SHF11316.1 flagellar hook-associated protein 3 FlgL [Halomonas ilicicola DSM 19980]